MDEVERIAKERRPKLLLAGWSAYSRTLDFERFREIADEVGALLMVDMAHFAGLVAAGLHPNPVPYADVVTSTVHKTLGGARGGLILCKEEHAKKINSRGVPRPAGRPARARHRRQGGRVQDRRHGGVPRAPAAHDRRRPGRRRRRCCGAGHGVNVLTGGTDVHLALVDLRDSELDGQQAEDRLHDIGITVNRNAVPYDPRPPMVTSGLRVGTARARHPRPAGRRLRGGRPDPGHRADARTSTPSSARARRARHRDRRPPPALRAPEGARSHVGLTAWSTTVSAASLGRLRRRHRC